HLGVPELDDDGRVVQIIEKPDDPPSSFGVTGIYFYDATVFDVIPTLTPSGRGELEITDVNNWFVSQQTMQYDVLDGFWGDADEFVHTNCDGTNVIMDVARRLDVSRVLHISTDEVYGSIEEGSFSEDDPLTPRSPYSASKAGSDLIALSYFTTYGLPVVISRSSNNF